MELREWLIILGLVLVAIILVDGVRRLQRQRRGLRMDLSQDIDASEPPRDPDDIAREERMSWELPNGGARVVKGAAHQRPDPLYTDDEGDDAADSADDASWTDDFRAERNGRSPRDDDPLDPARSEAQPDDERFDEAPFDDEPFDDESLERAPRRRDEMGQRVRSAFARGGARLRERRQGRDASSRRMRGSAHDDDPLPTPGIDWQDERPFDESTQAAFEHPAPARESDEPRHPAVERAERGMIRGEQARSALRDAEEVVVISVLPKEEAGFDGIDLLQLVLACGLRLDDEGVFHRFETESSESPLQFSMVNVLKPGIFDLDDIEGQAAPGVTFLMPLPGAEAPREAFEAMYETAMVLVRNLGGELKDEHRSVMTAQTVAFARQRVNEFERRWRLHRHHTH